MRILEIKFKELIITKNSAVGKLTTPICVFNLKLVSTGLFPEINNKSGF